MGSLFFLKNDGFIPLKQARSPSIQVGTARCRGTQVVGVAGTWAQSFWNALENGKGTYAYRCCEALLVSSSYKFGLLLINCSFSFPIPACLLYNGAISLTTRYLKYHASKHSLSLPLSYLIFSTSTTPNHICLFSTKNYGALCKIRLWTRACEKPRRARENWQMLH